MRYRRRARADRASIAAARVNPDPPGAPVCSPTYYNGGLREQGAEVWTVVERWAARAFDQKIVTLTFVCFVSLQHPATVGRRPHRSMRHCPPTGATRTPPSRGVPKPRTRAPPRAGQTAPTSVFTTSYTEVTVPAPRPGPPAQDVVIADVTADVVAAVTRSGVREGTATILSRHTTVGVTINEAEVGLEQDLRDWLLRLAPPDERCGAATGASVGVRYRHNDIDARPASDTERDRCLANGWAVDTPEGLAAWRAQEPINAHSHIAAIAVGQSLCVPVTQGALALGQWQSILVVDCDGPRERRVAVQVMGLS